MESIKIVESAKHDIDELEQKIKIHTNIINKLQNEIHTNKHLIEIYCQHVYVKNLKNENICKFCGYKKL